MYPREKEGALFPRNVLFAKPDPMFRSFLLPFKSRIDKTNDASPVNHAAVDPVDTSSPPRSFSGLRGISAAFSSEARRNHFLFPPPMTLRKSPNHPVILLWVTSENFPFPWGAHWTRAPDMCLPPGWFPEYSSFLSQQPQQETREYAELLRWPGDFPQNSPSVLHVSVRYVFYSLKEDPPEKKTKVFSPIYFTPFF